MVLVALCFVAVLAISVGSYLALSTQAMKLSNRTFQTTLSEHLAEMGLEYGIAAMNRLNDINPPPPFAAWAGSGTTATWSPAGANITGLITLPAGKYGDIGVVGLINVRIDNYTVPTNARPWDPAANYLSGQTVTYGGNWYRCPAGSLGQPPPGSPWMLVSPMIHAEGVVTLPDGTNQIKTQLVATLSCSSPFPNTLAATNSLALGAGTSVDSYDSTAGTYTPNTGFSAVVAGSNTASTAVSMLGAVINGYVAAPADPTSSFSPNWSYDASTVVKGTVAVPFPKVDLTRVSRSPYIPAFSILPAAAGTPLVLASGANTDIGTSGNVYPTVYSVAGDLDFSAASTTLTINGPVVLDVSGNIILTGNGSKIILPMLENGSAEIHFVGTLNAVAGLGGGIENDTLNPQKLVLLSSNPSSFNVFSSSIDFYGAIYLPNGGLTWTGANLFGAVSAATFTASGPAFHYDTSLQTLWVPGVESPYVISKWREVTSSADPDHVNF